MKRKLSQDYKAVWVRDKYRNNPEFARRVLDKRNKLREEANKDPIYRQKELLRRRISGRRDSIEAMEQRLVRRRRELVPLVRELQRLESILAFRKSARSRKPAA